MPIFRSPAKLNLFFRVLSKRSDFFHEIASIYQAIDIFDIIEIKKSDRDHFSCSDPELVGNDNLVCKALRLFRKKTNVEQKVSIHLEKNIPVGSGLGGGSSNAATTLWGLSCVFNLHFSKNFLMELSKPLGSDVPFFFSRGSALCLGRGEVVNELKLPKYKGWIINPHIHVSTHSVYEKVSLDSVSKIPVSKLVESFENSQPIFINDLEHAAFALQPELEKVKLNYPFATLTGSGSCFFSMIEPKENQETYIPFQSISCLSDDWF